MKPGERITGIMLINYVEKLCPKGVPLEVYKG